MDDDDHQNDHDLPQDPSETIFGIKNPNLYECLSISNTSTLPEIRKAYRQLALRYHPDKIPLNSSDQIKLDYKVKFEQIGFAYKILSDPQSRDRWDKTGRSDDQSFFFNDGGEKGWTEYFKELWSGEVNAKTIDEFKAKYQGSDEELNDLHNHYLSFEGDLEEILNHTLCSTFEDEPRLILRLENSIQSGLLPVKPLWNQTKSDIRARSKRAKKSKREALEAEALAKELGVHHQLFGNDNDGDSNKTMVEGSETAKKNQSKSSANSEDSLRALIQARSAGRHESLIAKLEAQAKARDQASKSQSNRRGDSGKKKSNNKKTKKQSISNDDDEDDHDDKIGDHLDQVPTEEEFQKIQAQIEARRNSSSNPKSKLDNKIHQTDHRKPKKRSAPIDKEQQQQVGNSESLVGDAIDQDFKPKTQGTAKTNRQAKNSASKQASTSTSASATTTTTKTRSSKRLKS